MDNYTCKIVDDQVIKIYKIVVHAIIINSELDYDKYSKSTQQWLDSPAGVFIKEHAIDKIEWMVDRGNFSQSAFIVRAVVALEETKLSEYYLRWGKNGSN